MYDCNAYHQENTIAVNHQIIVSSK